jgi:hypothetical protein
MKLPNQLDSMPADALLTAKQVRERFDIGEAELRNLVKSGLLPEPVGSGTGKWRRWRGSDLLALELAVMMAAVPMPPKKRKPTLKQMLTPLGPEKGSEK